MPILSRKGIILRLALTMVITINALGAFPVSASPIAELPSTLGLGDSVDCRLYPIALSSQLLEEAGVGDALTDVLNGTRPGNFGWLTWDGSPAEPALVASLTPPGNSETYVNPDDADDHTVSVGDWVRARPDLANSRAMRQALEALKAVDIIVPVWDEVRAQGDNAAYRVAVFARLRLTDYQLPQQNRISVIFLGYACEGAVIRLDQSLEAITLTPTLDLAFNADQTDALPGDTVTYTATLANAGATLTLTGTLAIENISDVTATVAYYSELVDYFSAPDTEGIPLAGTATVLDDYAPVSPAPLTEGITLTAAGRPSPGVAYSPDGSSIAGTRIEPGGVAVWDYQAVLSLSAEQVNLLLDAASTQEIRNSFHVEVLPRLPERGQPFFQHQPFARQFQAQSGSLANATITLTLPDGQATRFDGTTVPPLAALPPGARASVEVSYSLPALAPREEGETNEAYLARLAAADGSEVSASVEATAEGNGGLISAPQRTATTVQHVPIVTLLKRGPETVEPGATAIYELTLRNVGSAIAREIALEDTLPDRNLGLIQDTPDSLEPGAGAVAHASHVVPNGQPPGALTDTALARWEDANDNGYGPVMATFTTEVLAIKPEGVLTLTPVFAGPNVVGTQQTLIATLKDTNGTPLPEVLIHFTVSGPNATNGEATTDAEGNAAFTYTGANNGFDSVQATAVIAGQIFESNLATVHWVTPLHTVTTSTIWGRFFTSDGSGVFNTPPTQTPVFSQAFPSINFNPPAGTVPGNTSDVNLYTRPFTNVVMDLNGNYAGTIVAQGNGYQAGVGPLYTFSAVFTGEFTVAAEGDAIFDFFSDDGFIFGIGNGAQRVSGANTNPPPSGLTPFEKYPVMGAYNRPTAPVRNSITVHFPAPGAYPFEIDYTECCGGQLALTLAVRETGFGVTPVGSLVVSPNSTQTRQTGQQQSFSIAAQDASGLPLANLQVILRVNGANTQALLATTDSSGIANFTYTGYNVGTDTVQAVAWAQGEIAAYSAEVKVNWQRGVPPPSDPGTPLAIPGWIGSPASESTVTGLVPIRLKSGITLQNGTIDYWPADNPDALTVLATNVSGSGGATLATLDTTTLTNGSYIVRLQGADAGGNRVNSGILLTVAGNYKPGRVRFTLTDLTVPLVGLPITIGRTYDSLERHRVGDFGYGWSLAIGNPRLEQDPAHNVTLTLPNGRRATFYFKPQSAGGIFGFLFYPRYLPEAGLYGSLTANGCGLLAISGGQYYCFPGGYYQPTEFTYTDPYGRVFVIGADGALRSITDLDGNTLTFTANGITSSTGANLTFERDAAGRILRITDPAGNVYQYGYDANGDLVSVSLPGVSDPITYRYEDHYFSGAVDPRGNSIIVDTYYPDGRLESETDALGNTFHYSYDLATRTTTVTNPDGGTVISTYDDYGMLLRQTDPLGHTTSYAYDGNHNLISRTDPLGHTTSYTYDSNGNQTSLTNPLGHTTYTTYNRYGGPTSKTDFLGNTQTIAYDAYFRPISIHDGLGTLAAFTWDAHGNLLSRADGNGQVTTFTYDAYGNLLSQSDPLGHTTTFTYDNLGRQTSATDARGNTTFFEYDALGHLRRVIEPLGKVTRYEYDPNGNRTAVIDPRGTRTTYEYDAANRLIAIHYPDGTGEQYTYDWRGNVLTHTDAAGHTTRYDYDPTGRLIAVTYADGAVVRYEYDAAGRKVRQIDSLGHSTSYSYDAADHLLQIAAPLGHTTSYTYDANGRRLVATDAAGRQTRYTYDLRGHLLRTTFADGSVIQQTYDGAGHLLTRRDQNGKITAYAYDEAGRLLSVTDPLGHTVSYAYDEAGNLLSITDANGHTTAFAYDALGRQTRKTWPDGSFEMFDYDPNDNVLAHHLADGHVNAFTYDALNRLTQIHYFDGQTVRFTYTPNGLRATVTDGRGLTRYEYDARDRLTRIVQPNGQTVSYTYDAAGRRTSLTTPAGTVTYAYDEADQLTAVSDPAGHTVTFAYNALGERTQKNLPNGVVVEYVYDDLGRLIHLAQRKDGLTLASYTYTLDAAGNRLSVSEADGSSIYWTYDDAYRLTSETRRDASGAITYRAAFTYDPAGNRLSQETTVNGLSSTVHYTYNALDQLITAGTAQYEYDGRGNLVRVTDGAEVATYAWDAADRLTGVILPDGSSANFGYDADGRRVQQATNAQVINYLWDEASPYGDVLLETDESGNTLASYVLGGAELLSQNRGGTIRYYLQDAQGSTRTLTDASGSVTDTYAYTAFGERLSHSGTSLNPYRYTGQQFDAASGLYYLRARYYDPALGRFLSRDPAEPLRTMPRELNRYVYVADNPLNAADPSGRFAAAEYSMANRESKEESTALEPVGKETASEVQALVDEYDWLLRNTAHLGEGAIRAIRAENLASQLVSEGLNSPGAQSLINDLAQVATYNPESNIVSLGRYPYYLDKGIEKGYTYFNLPGNSYQTLQNAGEEFVEAVNRQFMYNQMEAAKDFGFSLGRYHELGKGSQLEYDLLVKSTNYMQVPSDIFDCFFKYIGNR